MTANRAVAESMRNIADPIRIDSLSQVQYPKGDPNYFMALQEAKSGSAATKAFRTWTATDALKTWATEIVYGTATTANNWSSWLSGGPDFANQATDQNVSANQLTYEFAYGTTQDIRVFTNGSDMGSWMVKSDYVVDALNKATSRALGGDYSPVNAGRSLTRESKTLSGMSNYVWNDFPSDALLGNNPARGYQGSIQGTVTPGAAIIFENKTYVPITLQMWDTNGAVSATHYPVGGKYQSLVPANNPNGKNAPLNSIYTFYNMQFLVPATGVPWSPTPSTGYKR